MEGDRLRLAANSGCKAARLALGLAVHTTGNVDWNWLAATEDGVRRRVGVAIGRVVLRAFPKLSSSKGWEEFVTAAEARLLNTPVTRDEEAALAVLAAHRILNGEFDDDEDTYGAQLASRVRTARRALVSALSPDAESGGFDLSAARELARALNLAELTDSEVSAELAPWALGDRDPVYERLEARRQAQSEP